MTGPAQSLADALTRVETEGSYTAYMAASNAVAALREAGSGVPYRLAVLRNFTIEPLLPVIEGELARMGFVPATYLGDFDAIAADALDSRSGLAAFDPQAIILGLWLETLAPDLVGRFPALNAAGVTAEIDRTLGFVRNVLSGMRRFTQAPVLLNNFPLPARPALGILDAQREHSHTEAVLTLNRGLRQIASEIGNVFMVDYMTAFAALGVGAAFDERNWLHRRSPLGRGALVPLGREYGKFLRALTGRVRKCVVMDCDNTLWGGIIGEDGLHGIQIGEGHPGSYHRGLQRELLNLYDRGVLIALCSKNNDADVLEVLRTHDGMLLREAHIATRRVNWDDKVSNLRAIARELNIGLDSLVFVDDSPFECGLVREQLPEVAVVELKPGHDLASQLTRHGHFDALNASADDKQRTEHFKADAVRRELQGGTSSLEEYLERLEMVAEVGSVREEVVPRVAQLTQKTNQFNLTTRRYTEDDIRRFAAGDDYDVLYVRVRDLVADLGIVGVAIMRSAGGTADIDTLLLSCRALGRGVEQVMVDELRQRAEDRGCQTIRGTYIPTAKNGQVANFYPSLGFAPEATDGQSTSFTAPVSALPRVSRPITVIRPRALQSQA